MVKSVKRHRPHKLIKLIWRPGLHDMFKDVNEWSSDHMSRRPSNDSMELLDTFKVSKDFRHARLDNSVIYRCGEEGCQLRNTLLALISNFLRDDNSLRPAIDSKRLLERWSSRKFTKDRPKP